MGGPLLWGIKMDRKKIANNILDLMVDPTVLPPERRLYFRPEEILDNRMYEQTRAFVDQAYGNQSQNSDMYPLRNRALKREVYGMDRRTLIASLDILSQTFKEADPIAKDLRTMAYAVSKMNDEELATRMAENAPENLDEGMDKSAKNPWMEHMKKVRKENPDKSLKELIGIAKKTYKKASEDEEIPSDEEISKMAEGLAETDDEVAAGDIENAVEDNWSVEAADAVQSALVSDILGEDISSCKEPAEKEEKKESAEKKKEEEEEKWADDDSQGKEAGKKKGPGIPDATGPYGGTDKCQMSEKKKESDDESEKDAAEEEKKESIEEKESAKEEEKEAEEDKVVDTDILATIEFDGIELTNPMAITEVGEMSNEEKQRLSQLFRDPEFEKLSDDDRAKLEQFSK